jgi:hypothetical protein
MDRVSTNNRRAVRGLAFFVIALLAALPTLAKKTVAFESLPAGQRLFYALNGLKDGTLEVRYVVDGKPYLTESIDLTNVTLPQKQSCRTGEALNGVLSPSARDLPPNDDLAPREPARRLSKDAASAAPQNRGRFIDKGRMIELLGRNPNEVRELHRLAGEGASITVEIYRSGNRVESLSFDQLVRRSAALRVALLLPVVVSSNVRGSAGVTKKAFVIKATDYLESCNDCTSSTPCDTECGYDPGKGGPETCGEYGADCAPVCYSSSTDLGYVYGSWTFVAAGDTGYGECFVTYIDNRWHNEYVTVYRRDVYQETRTCPNAPPSCEGCYTTQTLVGYEYLYVYCYYRTASYCSPAYVPFCDQLCSIDGFTYCE